MEFGLALTGALLASACGDHRVPADQTAQRYAEQLTLQEQTIPDFKPVTATITSRDQAEARARLGGLLAVMSVRAGDVVRRGQLIGRVIDPQVGFQTQAYDAQIAAAQAQAEQAQAELGRTRDLFDKGVYAKARLDQQVAAARSAAGALNAARAQRAASAALGGEGAILAPADGQVLQSRRPGRIGCHAGPVRRHGHGGADGHQGRSPRGRRARAVGRHIGPSGRAANSALLDTSAVVTQVYPAVTGGQGDGRPHGARSWAGHGRPAGGHRHHHRPPQCVVLPRRFIATRDGVDYARVLGADGVATMCRSSSRPAPTADTTGGPLRPVPPGDVLVRGGAAR